MDKKLFILVVIALIFVMGCFVSAEEVDPLGKYDPPVTVSAARILTSWMTFDKGDDLDNNWYMDTYKEQLGINVDWEWTAPNWGTPYEQKINMSLAVNELPDIMCVYGSILQKLIKADKLMDLTEVYEKYASDHLKNLMNANDGLMKKMATVDGKLIAIPSPKSPDVGVVLIRKDWLDNLGLNEPESFEELEEVAKAFVTMDPDGNGKDDTYGIAMDKDFSKAENLFNMFHAYSTGWREVDGERLLYNRVHPSQKNVWSKLHEWYKEGILDREFVLKDNNKEVEQDVVSERVGIYFGVSNSIPDPAIRKQHLNNPDSSWTWVPISKLSPDGEPVLTFVNLMPGDFNIVTKGCEHPEAMIKMLNLRLAVRSADKPDWVKSYDYQDTAEGSLSFFMAPVRIDFPAQNIMPELIKKARETLKKGGSIESLPYEARNIYEHLYEYKENKDPAHWPYYELYKEGGSADYRYAKIAEEEKSDGETILFQDKAKWLAVPAEGEYGSDLHSRFIEFLTKAVLNGDIEDNFEAWVDYYYSNGGTEITKQHNEKYQQKKANN